MQTRTPLPVAPSSAHSLRDALRPVRGERDPVDRVLREAPRRERCLARIPAVCGDVLHGTGLYGARAAESFPFSFRSDARGSRRGCGGRARSLPPRAPARGRRSTQCGTRGRPRHARRSRRTCGARRQLLRGPHPTRGSGAQESEEHSETLFVVEARHLTPRPVSGPHFFPRAPFAIFPRHRAMRLAIVPDGISSSSAIVL